jgi:adenosylcobalamin-dependent ribonucleoside-triphosphate reductase
LRNDVVAAEPSMRSRVIARRTYSRPLPGGGFEDWSDVVGRVIRHQRWLWQRALGDKPLTAAEEDELEQLRHVLLTREGSVSGRTLWLGGTEVAKRREASMFNCLRGNTSILTKERGAVPIESVLGNYTVLNSLGQWVAAEIKNFGTQDLLPYRFGHDSHSFTIYATPEHRWRLVDGTFVNGKTLNVGDKVPFVCPPRDIADEEDYNKGIQHGLIYGDGSGRVDGTFIIRLCSDAEDLLPYFAQHTVSYPPSANGDPIVYVSKSSAWTNFKALPDLVVSDSYMIGFIRGWLAAGGSVTKAGQVTLCLGDKEEVWFRREAARYGYFCAGASYLPNETNFGLRNKASKILRLMKACVGPEDFIIQRKAARVTKHEMVYTYYGVDRSQEFLREMVYCAVVPGTQDFVLGNGLLTGNCAFTKIETVHDVVDAFWLLLQGCGVGFEPVPGTLNGFTRPVEVRVIRSERDKLEQKRGRETNEETFTSVDGRTVWRVSIGDSAEAWARSVGKLLAQKRPADVLELDFSQIRPAGERLAGYGWISSGDATFYIALSAIAEILNKRAGTLLTRLDILDVLNHLGTTLSSRRSAEIALVPYGDPEWIPFAEAKKDFWLHNNNHRQQSNNSLLFASAPDLHTIADLFERMQRAGGSEPGFINAQEAKLRAPWFSGVNPCAEILLPNKGFCNLVELNLAAFNGRLADMWLAARLLARANYRQTCVNLVDGVLQRAWHENNEFLRLCGVGVTGVAQWESSGDRAVWKMLRRHVTNAACQMADELGLPRPKAVTTVKPSGTLSKIMDTTEGVHKPLGKYIFNNVRFSKHDPFVDNLRRAKYRVFDDPSSSDAVLVTFPVAYEGVEFDEVDGKSVNLESAVAQLERYKMLMECYVDHNCSITVSYSPEEVPEIVSWLHDNWSSYVGMSFLYRTDPSKTAADLGYLYLPQEVVTKADYDAYVKMLRPVKGMEAGAEEMKTEVDYDLVVDSGSECATGVCPIR